MIKITKALHMKAISAAIALSLNTVSVHAIGNMEGAGAHKITSAIITSTITVQIFGLETRFNIFVEPVKDILGIGRKLRFGQLYSRASSCFRMVLQELCILCACVRIPKNPL